MFEQETSIREAVSSEVGHLIEASNRLMISLYPAESCHLTDADVLQRDGNLLLAAFDETRAVGCVGLIRTGTVEGEIKRLYVLESHRGRGIAKALMKELERYAVSWGIDTLLLETGIHQMESLRLYSSLDYTRTAPFGSYLPDPLSVFMAKTLPPAQCGF